MDAREICRSIACLWSLYRLSAERKPLLPKTSRQAWDIYWREAGQQKTLYARIAYFYRKILFAHALGFYFAQYFRDAAGMRYLHAGCGSGDSDTHIGFFASTFVYLDISPVALAMARSKKRGRCIHFVCADMERLPFKPGVFDGMCNLGVMEHFPQQQLPLVFKEFSLVLVKHGRFILFWPPWYGLSRMVLSVVHFMINKILSLRVALYPKEESLFRSVRWVQRFLPANELRIIKTHFGLRDFFSCVVLIGERI